MRVQIESSDPQYAGVWVTRARADALMRATWEGLQDDRGHEAVDRAYGVLTALAALYLYNAVEFADWHEKLKTCPDQGEHHGG